MDFIIVELLYEEKYNLQYSFEFFIDLIVNGLALLKSESLSTSANLIEQKAMRLALKYNFLVTSNV